MKPIINKGLRSVLKLFGYNINSLLKLYETEFNLRKKFRGKKDAVDYFKKVANVAERYALHQKLEAIPWTKSDNDNFPVKFKRFKRYLRSDNNLTVIFTLSIFRSIESQRLPISKDISSVVDSFVYDSLVQDIIKFLPKIKWLKPLNLEKIKFHFTTKNGPNGPALKTSDLDLAGIFQDPKLLKSIQLVESKLQMENRLDETFKRGSSGITGKIVQFPEKSGKTRTIGVVDYYSQKCLKPLHDKLMSLLRSLVSDGTYSHENVGKYFQEKTKDKDFIYCTDLTAATDRYPAVIQREVLKCLIADEELCESLWCILGERTFKVSWSNEVVRYTVGQPMGCYGSWPLFALSHHALVQYCAYLTNCKNIHKKYRLIGDDFGTIDKEVSIIYKQLMTRLGVSINVGKTVESNEGSNYACAEIAKQIFLNGRNLTPLTPGFVTDLRKPHMFHMCWQTMINRYDNLPVSPSVVLAQLFPKKETFERVWCLASNPVNGVIKPSDEGYDQHSPWAKKDLSLLSIVLNNLKINLLTMKGEILFSTLLDRFDGIPGPQQKGDGPPNEAQTYAVEQLRKELQDKILMLNQAESVPDVSQLSFDGLDYIPDPDAPFMERKEMRYKLQAYLIEQVLPELPERDGKVSMLGF